MPTREVAVLKALNADVLTHTAGALSTDLDPVISDVTGRVAIPPPRRLPLTHTRIGDHGSGGFGRIMGRVIPTFVQGALKTPAPRALDDPLAERLWTQTEQWASRGP